MEYLFDMQELLLLFLMNFVVLHYTLNRFILETQQTFQLTQTGSGYAKTADCHGANQRTVYSGASGCERTLP